MPAIDTGDILYMESFGTGHMGMALDAGNIIHAQNKGNFHRDMNDRYDAKKQKPLPSLSNMPGTRVFRAPWDRCVDAPARKAELLRVSDAISRGAEYGKYRAVRVLLGAGGFGPDAYKRFMKYRQRYEANKGTPDNFALPDQEVVKTVTCAEAVMITYQLTFPMGERPFFINLDAAHTMPRDLRDWFRPNGWTEITD